MSGMTKAQKAERDEARERLREMLPPGATVYTVLRHVSRSGMSRLIDLYFIEDNEPHYITGLVCRATGHTFDAKRDALRIGGCGMDMGFAVVYDLSHHLYADGFGCIGKGCPSNDHSNGDRDYRTHEERSADQLKANGSRCSACDGRGWTERGYLGGPGTTREDCRTCHGKGKVGPGHWHGSGGYCLNHRWLG